MSSDGSQFTIQDDKGGEPIDIDFMSQVADFRDSCREAVLAGKRIELGVVVFNFLERVTDHNLRQMLTYEDSWVNIAAAWEIARRAVEAAPDNARDLEGRLQLHWFIGYLEAKLCSRVPDEWRQSVLTGRVYADRNNRFRIPERGWDPRGIPREEATLNTAEVEIRLVLADIAHNYTEMSCYDRATGDTIWVTTVLPTHFVAGRVGFPPTKAMLTLSENRERLYLYYLGLSGFSLQVFNIKDGECIGFFFSN